MSLRYDAYGSIPADREYCLGYGQGVTIKAPPAPPVKALPNYFYSGSVVYTQKHGQLIVHAEFTTAQDARNFATGDKS